MSRLKTLAHSRSQKTIKSQIIVVGGLAIPVALRPPRHPVTARPDRTAPGDRIAPGPGQHHVALLSGVTRGGWVT